jgi:hypothetical protein
LRRGWHNKGSPERSLWWGVAWTRDKTNQRHKVWSRSQDHHSCNGKAEVSLEVIVLGWVLSVQYLTSSVDRSIPSQHHRDWLQSEGHKMQAKPIKFWVWSRKNGSLVI